MPLANKRDKRSNAFSCDRHCVSAAYAMMSILPGPYRFARPAYRSLLHLRCGRFSKSRPCRTLGGFLTPAAFSRPSQGLFYRLAFECAFRACSTSSNLPNWPLAACCFSCESSDDSSNHGANWSSYAADCRTRNGASCLLRDRRNLDIFRRSRAILLFWL